MSNEWDKCPMCSHVHAGDECPTIEGQAARITALEAEVKAANLSADDWHNTAVEWQLENHTLEAENARLRAVIERAHKINASECEAKDWTDEKNVAAVNRLIHEVNHLVSWHTDDERVAARLDLSLANDRIKELETELDGGIRASTLRRLHEWASSGDEARICELTEFYRLDDKWNVTLAVWTEQGYEHGSHRCGENEIPDAALNAALDAAGAPLVG